MFTFLAKKIIPNNNQYTDTNVRKKYGMLAACVGILNNMLLFGMKFFIGSIMNSVAIIADGVNNLSDAGSSVISLISFKLSAKPADEKHPFGHARYESIASMLVACFIMLLGVELLKSGITKVIHPKAIEFQYLSLIVLLFSIVIKCWMYTYQKKYARLLQSSVMHATAADSISDAVATSAVLLSVIISKVSGFELDGYVSIIVSCFILYTGWNVITHTLDEILGKAPDEKLVNNIQDLILRTKGVLGMHDLMIHEYGANRIFASAHVEVNYKDDVLESHDMIDNIEREARKKLQIELVLHMDPIDLDDPYTMELKQFLSEALSTINNDLSLHDFRIVRGKTHTNVVFDIVVPFHVHILNAQILEKLNEHCAQKKETLYLVVSFDRAYTSIEKKA